MSEPIYEYDTAEALGSAEAISEFMADAFETGDAAYIVKALGVAARARGMTEIARATPNLTDVNTRSRRDTIARKA